MQNGNRRSDVYEAAVVPQSIESLCGDETAPGNRNGSPFIRVDPNKPHRISLWWQTAASYTSLRRFPFCIRVCMFRANAKLGIADPPAGKAEEMISLIEEMSGMLTIDSLYSTPSVVENFATGAAEQPTIALLAALNPQWYRSLIGKISSDKLKVEGSFSVLVKPLGRDDIVEGTGEGIGTVDTAELTMDEPDEPLVPVPEPRDDGDEDAEHEPERSFSHRLEKEVQKLSTSTTRTLRPKHTRPRHFEEYITDSDKQQEKTSITFSKKNQHHIQSKKHQRQHHIQNKQQQAHPK